MTGKAMMARLTGPATALLAPLVALSRCLLLIIICLAGCTGRSTPPPVWLAHVATRSGPDKDAGESAARGIRLAVEEIDKNVDQGLGPPLKVIHSDTHGKLDAFEAEAVRLVTVNRVALLLGGSTPAEVERLDRAHGTVVSPCGTRPAGASDGVYVTGIGPAQHAKSLGQFAAQNLNAEALVLIEDDRREDLASLAEAIMREWRAAKKDAPPHNMRRLRFGKDTKLAELVKALPGQLQEKPASLVIFAGRPEDLGELGSLSIPVLFAGDEVSAKSLTALGRGLKELYWVTAFVTTDDAPRARDFAARYKTAFSDDADVHAALAYGDVKLLYDAICRSKDTLTDKRIREELGKIKDFAGLTGALSFTKERQLSRPAFVVRWDGATVKIMKRYDPDP
jgi:branched-chain amino acid transport system substrate-binding protein